MHHFLRTDDFQSAGCCRDAGEGGNQRCGCEYAHLSLIHISLERISRACRWEIRLERRRRQKTATAIKISIKVVYQRVTLALMERCFMAFTLLLLQHVSGAPDGMNQLFFKGVVYLPPQIADIHVYNICLLYTSRCV